jgi:hypothetical protein
VDKAIYPENARVVDQLFLAAGIPQIGCTLILGALEAKAQLLR